MSKLASTFALGALLAMSACGPLQRLRTRRAPVSDSAAMAIVPAPVATQADTPSVFGPFPDTVATARPDTPVLIDDSGMAMPWWLMRLEYATFSGKAKAHYEGPDESRDFTLSVRVEAGKRIWMSVVGSALGISMEAFRAVLTPDSMIAINRIDKEVIRAPFSEIGNLFPISGDFYTLEAVLVGNRLPGALRLTEIFRDTVDGNKVVQGDMPGGSQSITFRLADSVMIGQRLDTRESLITLRYDNYAPSDKGRFSTKRRLLIEDGAGKQTLDLEYTSFTFDEPVDMPISIPSKYKQR